MVTVFYLGKYRNNTYLGNAHLDKFIEMEINLCYNVIYEESNYSRLNKIKLN